MLTTPLPTPLTQPPFARTNVRVPWARTWRMSIAIATVLGPASALFIYAGMTASGRPLTLRTAMLAGLPDWYLWACLMPIVFWLGLRWRMERGAWVNSLLVHAPACVIVVLTELLLLTAFNHVFYYNPWAPAPAVFTDAYVRNVLISFHYGMLFYWAIVAAAHAYLYHVESQQRAAHAASLRERNGELETQLARAQLDVLRSQLHPHFLFNAFNTVSGLIREGRAGDATDMVAHLGQLFRLTLKTMDRQTIALREDLELVDAYVSIERIRFGDHLDIRIDIEPDALELAVPSMLLQPLVENAILHGVRGRQCGQVIIRATRDQQQLRLEVEDNGPGPNDAHEENSVRRGSGFQLGLANVRSRLACLYGREFEFSLAQGEAGATRALVRIPASAVGPVTTGAA